MAGERLYLVKTPEGEELGPVDENVLVKWTEEGKVTLECKVRTTLVPNWEPAIEVPALKKILKMRLVEKIESINRLKKATGMVAATAYAIPPIPFLATTLSVIYLHRGAKKLIPEIPKRLEGIDEILRSKGKLR